MKTFAAALAIAGLAVAQAPPAPYTSGVPTSMAMSGSSSGVAPRPIVTGTVRTTVTTTIYCPTSTTFICGGTTYAVSTPTYITATCTGKCAVTPVATTAASPTPTKPASYTGAANNVQVGQVGALAAAALGLLVL